MKTRDLTGIQLDWAVAKALRLSPRFGAPGAIVGMRQADCWLCEVGPAWVAMPRFSQDWRAAGPIIAQHAISIIRCDDDRGTDAKGLTTLERIPVGRGRWAEQR